MARIAGVNIPNQKRVPIGLTYIHGIGRTTADEICQKVGIPAERRVNELTDDEVLRIRELIDRDYTVEGDLRRPRGRFADAETAGRERPIRVATSSTICSR